LLLEFRAGWLTLALCDVRRPWLVQALFFTGDVCSVAGLLAAYYAAGRAGVIDLLRRAVTLKAPIAWWLYALCLPFLWQVCIRALSGALHGGIGHLELKSLAGFVSTPVLFLFLTGPLGEEFGWRGFLLPRLLQARSALWGSVILGIVWALWHTPLYYKSWLATPWKGPEFFLAVICFSILITALYVGSRGNLFLCIVMHWMINAAQQVGKKMFPDVRDQGLGYVAAELVVLTVLTRSGRCVY
jgi:membrane protease YdiL (CAAX protease family)